MELEFYSIYIDVQESKKRKDDLWNQYQQIDQELKREKKFALELEEIILRSQGIINKIANTYNIFIKLFCRKRS